MDINQLQSTFVKISAPKDQTKTTVEKDPKLEKSAKELEGLFLSFVLKAMEKTIPKENGNSNTMANMMFSSVLGQSIAGSGGIGLTKFFYETLNTNDSESMSALKEKINNPTYINTDLGRIHSND